MHEETHDVPKPANRCGGPSIAVLRRLDTGELHGAERERTQAHVDGCESCRAVLADFAAERSAVAVALPFSRLAAHVEEKQRPWYARWSKLVAALAVPALAAAAFVLTPAPVEDGPLRTKGTVSLSFVVKEGERVRDGLDGEALPRDAAIRLKYGAQAHPFALIVGVDADGTVYPYWSAGNRSTHVSEPSAFAPNAIEFDADPRPERIFALYSDRPVSLEEVGAAAREALDQGTGIEALKQLPIDAEQATVLVRKQR